MGTFLSILAFAILVDILFNGGFGIASVIEAFHKPAKTTQSEIELVNEKITELNEELSDLEDELTESIEDGETHVERGIRSKISIKREILTSYLIKLKSLDNKTD